MPEYTGPIQALELARWLWLLVFFPFVGAVVHAGVGSGVLGQAIDALARGDAEGKGGSATPRVALPARTTRTVALGSLGLSFVTGVAYTGLLVRQAPYERFFLAHVWQLLRSGPVDVGFDLAFDPLSAVLVVTVTLVALLVPMFVLSSGDLHGDDAHWRFFAWFELFVFFVLLALLADNLILLFVAWEGTAIAGYGLVTLDGGKLDEGPGIRAFAAHAVSAFALVVAGALLFWGLGGSWTPEGDYQADLEPRVAPVTITPGDELPPAAGPEAAKGTGYLTVTGISGALVYANDSRTPLLGASGLPMRTPFRKYELKGGAYSFRIAPDDDFRLLQKDDKRSRGAFVTEGGVLVNYTVPKQPVGGDHELALSVVGSTLRFRELRDQLVMMDGKGAHPMRYAVENRPLSGGLGGARAPGARLLTFVLLLVIVAALLKAWPASTEPVGGVLALVYVASPVLGAYVIARVSFLLALSPAISALLGATGAALAVGGAFATTRQLDVSRILASVTTSQTGLIFLSFGSGAYAAGVLEIVVYAGALTCLRLCLGSVAGAGAGGDADLRRLGKIGSSMPGAAAAYRLACIALAFAPVPLLGAFWSTAGILRGVLSTTMMPTWLANAAFAAGLAAVPLTAFGLWRSYYLLFTSPKTAASAAASPTGVSATHPAFVLGAGTLATGLVLGASAREVGGTTSSLMQCFLAPVFATIATHADDLGTVGRVAVLGAVLVTVFVGQRMARKRYGEGRPDDWEAREPSVPGQGFGASLR